MLKVVLQEYEYAVSGVSKYKPSCPILFHKNIIYHKFALHGICVHINEHMKCSRFEISVWLIKIYSECVILEGYFETSYVLNNFYSRQRFEP